MADPNPQTTTAPEEDTVLRMTRVFDAPREKVFRAWTDPEALKQWWGPEGYKATVDSLESTPGGHYRTCMTSPDGNDMWVGGLFKEVKPFDRLVFTFAWEQEDGKLGHETQVTVEFREVDGGTELTLVHEFFLDAESRDLHGQGWTSSLNCLDETL